MPTLRKIYNRLYEDEGIILTGLCRRTINEIDYENLKVIHETGVLPERLTQAPYCDWISKYTVPNHARKNIKEVEKLQPGFLGKVRPILNGNVNLILTGGVGTGKTCAANALAVIVASEGKWIEIVNWTDLLQTFTGTAANTDKDINESATVKFKHYLNCDILFIDDFARTALTSDNRLNKLYELMEHRLKKGTVITTNLNSNDLLDRVGDFILDRLNTGIVYKFTGQSLRREF